MIANSVAIFVFNSKFYIPTPAQHEIGSWETEPVAVVDFCDLLGFTEALKKRLFQLETIISRDTMPEGFICRKYTKHKSDTAFVRDVDRWHLGTMAYESTDVGLSLWSKRGRGYTGAGEKLFQFSEQELAGRELEMFGKVAKTILQYYDECES